MAVKHARPLSPHLSIWKPGAHMAISIFNRVFGVGLATAGTLMLVSWLLALAGGKEAYEGFMSYANWWPGYLITIGLTFAFFFHFAMGARHFVMDAGAGFELKANRLWAWLIPLGAVLLTAAVWLIILGKAL